MVGREVAGWSQWASKFVSFRMTVRLWINCTKALVFLGRQHGQQWPLSNCSAVWSFHLLASSDHTCLLGMSRLVLQLNSTHGDAPNMTTLGDVSVNMGLLLQSFH